MMKKSIIILCILLGNIFAFESFGQTLTVSVTSGSNPGCVGDKIWLKTNINNGTAIWTLDGPVAWSGSAAFTFSVTITSAPQIVKVFISGHGFAEITILARPEPGNPGLITGETIGCPGQSLITYTVPPIINAATYEWTLPNGATGTSITNAIDVEYLSSPVSGNITVKGINACGVSGGSSSLSVNMNSLPGASGPVSGNTSVCASEYGLVYSVSPITDATKYIWTLPNGASVIGSDTTNNIMVNYDTLAVSGDIIVTGYNTCGEGTPFTLPIDVSPLPLNAGAISGATIVCVEQNTETYSIPAITDATSYIWTLPNGATGTSTTNSIDVFYGTSALSGVISVKGLNSCGEGLSSTLIVNVNYPPLNDGVISGLTTVCQEQGIETYTVSPITNATSYIWTLPSGATGISTTNNIDVSFGATSVSGDIIVKGYSACGDGNPSILPITVNPLPEDAGTILGTATVCQGYGLETYTVSPITNATSYIWTLPSGATGTSTTNNIDVSFGATSVSGDITVIGSNSCGYGDISILPLTINPLPSVPSISLSGNTLVSDAPIGNQWYDANGIINGANNQDYTPSSPGNYYVIVTLFGCDSDPSNVINTGVTNLKSYNYFNNLKVYPNPAVNELILEMKDNYEEFEFEIFDSVGKVVFKGNLIKEEVVRTTDFKPGLYLIKISNDKYSEVMRFIKK